MRHDEQRLVGQRGVELYSQAWLPSGEPTTVLTIAHGLAEHGGRYKELAARRVAQGHALYVLDHRGHGRSGGRRAQVDHFAWLVADLGLLIERARNLHPAARHFLLGHSMGGAIALSWALDHPGELDGLILSGPAIAPGSAVSPLKSWMIRLLSRVLPNLGAIRLPATTVSRDPAVVRAYEEDPLVFHGAIPARTLAELLGAMQRLPARAAELRMPLLILQGSADLLVPYADVAAMFERLGSTDKVVRIYDGLFHEVLNEPERAQVLADIDGWLAAHA